jgi:hypothetical protein
MGIDWVRKAEEQYRHRLQISKVSELELKPLLEGEEIQVTTYPCHWIREEDVLPVGTDLSIFYRGDRANIAVLHQSSIVAEVRGEAALDLKRYFSEHPQLHDLLAVRIVGVGQASEPFFVEARARRRR